MMRVASAVSWLAADRAVLFEEQRAAGELAHAAADACGVPLAVVIGRRRSKSVGVARAAVASALRGHGWTLVRIGRFLGGRDHSSIAYLLQAHAWRQAGASAPFKVWKGERHATKF